MTQIIVNILAIIGTVSLGGLIAWAIFKACEMYGELKIVRKAQEDFNVLAGHHLSSICSRIEALENESKKGEIRVQPGHITAEEFNQAMRNKQ